MTLYSQYAPIHALSTTTLLVRTSSEYTQFWCIAVELVDLLAIAENQVKYVQ